MTVSFYIWKLFIIDPTTRYHPSTSTNSIILNGSDIMMGGSIIMPMDISTDAITMSSTRNGMYIRKPMVNPTHEDIVQPWLRREFTRRNIAETVDHSVQKNMVEVQ